jgi:glycosyltransferase involved in cell wall biosynthesis
MKPLFSVVIPTYNHAHFLERALQSVINQKFTDWEIIIIDNHSQDNTDLIVEKFKDPRIKFFKIINNGIIAASRNKGVNEAKGEWIAFLDSDDYWDPLKLQSCLEVISDEVDFIYHDLKVVGQKENLFSWNSDKTRQTKGKPLIDLLLNGNLIGNSSVVVRRVLIEKAGLLEEDSRMIGAEDFNAWLKIAELTDKFLFLPKYLGFYEYHLAGISRKDMSECYRVATINFFHLLDPVQRDKIKAHISYMKGRYLFMNGKFRDSRKFFIESILKGKLSIKLKAFYFLVFSIVRIQIGINKI